MACCGQAPLPTPGTGVARGFKRGQKLVYRILDPETDECLPNAYGECSQFNTDSQAYQAWQNSGRVGYVRATWV